MTFGILWKFYVLKLWIGATKWLSWFVWDILLLISDSRLPCLSNSKIDSDNVGKWNKMQDIELMCAFLLYWWEVEFICLLIFLKIRQQEELTWIVYVGVNDLKKILQKRRESLYHYIVILNLFFYLTYSVVKVFRINNDWGLSN